MTTVLSIEGGNPGVLRCDGDELYVGTEWEDDRAANAVYVLDRRTFEVRKRWPMPHLTYDLAIVGDTLVASLGSGELAHIPGRGLGSGRMSVRKVAANAPQLAADGSELFWGTYLGELHNDRGCFATSTQRFQSIALDAVHVYAGYDDGKLRVYRRDNGKRVKIVEVGKRKVKCAFDGQLFTANEAGTITRWSSTFTAEVAFEHDISASQYGIIDLGVFGDHVLSRTHEDVRVWDRDGNEVSRWLPEDSEIHGAVLDGDALLVSVDARVVRVT